jgi:hypothetical protein
LNNASPSFAAEPTRLIEEYAVLVRSQLLAASFEFTGFLKGDNSLGEFLLPEETLPQEKLSTKIGRIVIGESHGNRAQHPRICAPETPDGRAARVGRPACFAP